MRSTLIAEIERITGDLLTPAMREEIADRAVKICADHNRQVALAAMDEVKKLVEQTAEVEAAKDQDAHNATG